MSDRESRQGLMQEQQDQYWLEQLAGSLPVLDFTDFVRPSVQSFFRGSQSLTVEEFSYDDLRDFSQTAGFSPEVVLIAAFSALLQRYQSRDDVVFGALAIGQTKDSTGGLRQDFPNLVALRMSAPRQSGVRDFLTCTAHTLEQTAQRRDYPFERLVATVDQRRDQGRAPIFQVALIVRDVDCGLVSRPITDDDLNKVAEHLMLCDLVVTSRILGNQITLSCEYDSDLFRSDTILRLLERFSKQTAGIMKHPDARLAYLSILSREETDGLISPSAELTVSQRQELCLHHLVEAQCLRTPNAIAAVHGSERLTYEQLNRRANQLARHLRKLRVGPETLVGISTDRCLEVLVGLLGILKAGGAYLPLDPNMPPERLDYMIKDARLATILQLRPGSIGSKDNPPHFINLRSDWPEIARHDGTNLLLDPIPHQLAYAIYTSGSTGRPKGVLIEHCSLVNAVSAFLDCLSADHGDAALALTTLSFDIAALELFLPLVCGGRVVIPDDEDAVDGTRLNDLIRRHHVTIMQATPSSWRLLLSSGLHEHPGLKALCGGETLTPELSAELLQLTPALWNVYGPTEATIWSTKQQVTSAAGPVPIGYPVTNTRVHILDAYLQPVPTGLRGELYIGGVGVARGYLNSPELTADRFIPDPFTEAPGARLYRTGDLVRSLPDGSLEFHGRLDNQVKIHGYRIELEEIENILMEHPAVLHAAVLVLKDGSEDYHLIAYVVLRSEKAVAATELHRYLRTHLPMPAVPSRVIILANMPLGPSGKIDRRALPMPETNGGDSSVQHLRPSTELEQAIATIWQAVLGTDEFGIDDNFFDLGGHSLLLGQVRSNIEQTCGVRMSVTELFRHPTIRSLAQRLNQNARRDPEPLPELGRYPEAHVVPTDIAIIGMAGRFPGAPDIDSFWRILRDGVESIVTLSDEELLSAGVRPAQLAASNYVRMAGILPGYDQFDAGFFEMSPREAALTDPQHRVFLECAWEALEDAGLDPDQYPGLIGVYAGASFNSYLYTVLWNSGYTGDPDDLGMLIGNEKDFLATRVSYKLNLRGPSLSVQTACSTSLVAVHLARQALLAGDCNIALAGGVAIRVPQVAGYMYQEGGIRSPDGHCRAFDSHANGTIFSSGVGIVVLKRFAEALRDNNSIYGIIRGSAVNNDGASKLGYTAPSIIGQANCIRAALSAANVSAETISYVETHGTGTALGDPVEIAALTEAFRFDTERCGYCAVGSVKTNIGHLDAAAGAAGLIKTLLALKHGAIPPSLHCRNPNPEIDFNASPFYVNRTLSDWRVGSGPRRAVVSSLGIGGTNAHVILEEPPSAAPTTEGRPYQLLLLSHRTRDGLQAASRNLACYLQEDQHDNLADVAYTLHTGRKSFRHRRMVVCQDAKDAVEALEQPIEASQGYGGECTDQGHQPVFMFPGQGSQHPQMAAGLYHTEPSFRELIDRCAELLRPSIDVDMRAVLYSSSIVSGGSDPLQNTALAQPALFVVEYALAQLWIGWGVRPQAMIGHSLGEYVAACLSGVLSLEDAVHLVAERGRLMATLQPGAMLAVRLSSDEANSRLENQGSLSLAAINGPRACVVAGPVDSIFALQSQLVSERVACQRLSVAHAFHSTSVEPIMARFANEVAKVDLSSPTVPYVSSVTGTWISSAEATDPMYWASQLRETVRFSEGLTTIMAGEGRILIEVGPSRALSGLAMQQVRGSRTKVVASLPHASEQDPDTVSILRAAGELWLAGVPIMASGFYAEQQRRLVHIPTYPFECQRYWVYPSGVQHRDAAGHAVGKDDETKQIARSNDPVPSKPHREQAEIEFELVQIWTESLGVLAIGSDDDFFELGGNSLIALSLVQKIRERFGTDLTITNVYERPTIRQLTSLITCKTEEKNE